MRAKVSRVSELEAFNSADVRRELEQARAQLARTAGEIARLSAQMTEPATREVLRLFNPGSANSVIGVNVEDTDLGARVRGVSPGGPAATAGVAVGDTIVAINDVELGRTAGNDDEPTATLLAQMVDVAPGDEVELRVLRDGDYRDVAVTAGTNVRVTYVGDGGPGIVLPGGRSGPRVFTNNAWTGLIIGPWSDVELVSLTPTLGEYFGTDKGLLVVRAGRAAELGLRDGDVVIDIGGREPQSPEHALRILQSFEAGESLQAAIMRQRRRESLAITVPSATDWSAAPR